MSLLCIDVVTARFRLQDYRNPFTIVMSSHESILSFPLRALPSLRLRCLEAETKLLAKGKNPRKRKSTLAWRATSLLFLCGGDFQWRNKPCSGTWMTICTWPRRQSTGLFSSDNGQAHAKGETTSVHVLYVHTYTHISIPLVWRTYVQSKLPDCRPCHSQSTIAFYRRPKRRSTRLSYPPQTRLPSPSLYSVENPHRVLHFSCHRFSLSSVSLLLRVIL